MLVFQSNILKMYIIKNGPFYSSLSYDVWQTRFPDSFRYPHSASVHSKISEEPLIEAANLSDFVAIRDRRKYRFIVAAANKLYLITSNQHCDAFNKFRMSLMKPIEK